MDIKDYLPILFERSNATITLWTLDSAVVLGILGFLATNRTALRRLGVAGKNGFSVVMILIFLGFAVSNLGAIVEASGEKTVILAELVKANPSSPLLQNLQNGCVSLWPNCMPPVSYSFLISLHVFVDVVTVTAIWWIPRMP